MQILVSFKPVAIVIGVLAILIICGYVASCFSQGQNPLSLNDYKAHHANHAQSAGHKTSKAPQ
jgi:hypothetical protein